MVLLVEVVAATKQVLRPHPNVKLCFPIMLNIDGVESVHKFKNEIQNLKLECEFYDLISKHV